MNRVQTTDAFWRSASVLVSELSFKWHCFMFLTLFCSKSAHFSEIQLVCDGRTDRRTDTPSYRDARTHLKKNKTKKYHRLTKDEVVAAVVIVVLVVVVVIVGVVAVVVIVVIVGVVVVVFAVVVVIVVVVVVVVVVDSGWT